MLAQIRTYILYVYYIDPEPKHAVELIILLLLCLSGRFILSIFIFLFRHFMWYGYWVQYQRMICHNQNID